MSLEELFVPTLPPAEVIFRAAIMYLVLLVLFRVFARTQMSRHAGFDVAVMFLVGTALRKTLVVDDDTITTGVLSLATLFALDWLVSLATWKRGAIAFLVEGRPIQIVKDGEPVERALRRTRINVHEIREHLRSRGTDDLSRVRAAFVERDGKITFVMKG
ncbi:MAG TPA: YetF domain-containing protein [Anaeromyxobacter sp.]